ncbi:MAG TPA: hypothetical protein VFU05_08550 [Cyclobacteriaceae bacterium]|nr:hypothetical protein [Cyclobacteriaceae bacterium]
MKKELKFRDNDFEVDIDFNRDIYSRLTSDTEFYQGQDPIIKFYLNNRNKIFSDELIEFLNLTGIDLTKENEIYHYLSDNLVIIEGWYDIVGKVLTDKKVSYYWDTTPGTTNVFFGNDARHGISHEFENVGTFRFEFAIVIQSEILKSDKASILE